MKSSGRIFPSSFLRPAAYQLVPLSKMLANQANCILISDGVGVGKTISAGYCIVYISSLIRRPSIVVCPPILVDKWIAELKNKFNLIAVKVLTKEEFYTMENELNSKYARKGQITYVVPNSLIYRTQFRIEPVIGLIAFDEIHTYRNRETSWFKAAMKLSHLAQFRIGLSATPINNSLEDLASELNILMPRFSWESIAAMVQDLWADERGRITDAFATRFTKEKLRIHFAKRRIRTYTVSYPTEYALQVKELLRSLKRFSQSFFDKVTYYRMASSSPYTLSKSLNLRRSLISSDPKLQKLREIISDDNKPRWIIFCEFINTAKYLEKELSDLQENIFSLSSETPFFEREEIIDQFRRTKKGILLLTPIGSEGIDLQFCDSIINYDLHWNPMKIEQRIGRIDRVGQMKNQIEIVNFLVSGSIDEHIMRVIQKKLALISSSIFSVANIFDKAKSVPIYDEESLETELKMSRQLITAFDYSNQLAEADYKVLKHFDISLCNPVKLAGSVGKGISSLPWIKSSKVTDSWLESIKTDSKYVLDLIRFYE